MGKPLFIWGCLVLTLLAVGAASLAGEGEDILICDFEGADSGNWKVEGAAFGTGPATGTPGGQMHVTGFEGKGLVNSFLGGDRPTGTLISPEFTIERDYIKFLIGGGSAPAHARGRAAPLSA